MLYNLIAKKHKMIFEGLLDTDIKIRQIADECISEVYSSGEFINSPDVDNITARLFDFLKEHQNKAYSYNEVESLTTKVINANQDQFFYYGLKYAFELMQHTYKEEDE